MIPPIGDLRLQDVSNDQFPGTDENQNRGGIYSVQRTFRNAISSVCGHVRLKKVCDGDNPACGMRREMQCREAHTVSFQKGRDLLLDRNPHLVHSERSKTARTGGDDQGGGETTFCRARHEGTVDCSVGHYRGMRSGEILAVTWGSLTGESVEITRRLYRGELETPTSHRATSEAALSDGLVKAIEKWRALSSSTASDGWVFPSERLIKPLTRDNMWNRHFLPKLKPVGLEWATFQVMRRTNSSLVNKSKIDPKVGADQRGHGIGVSLDIYTQSDREEKRAAVNPPKPHSPSGILNGAIGARGTCRVLMRE